MTLYERLKAAGIQTESHESDLYFPVTAESTAILKASRLSWETFWNQVEGGTWYYVFGAFDPFWRSRSG